MELSNRVNAIKESPTLAITAKAGKLKAEGKDVIALAAGEPDFDTRNTSRMRQSKHQQRLYQNTPVSGTPGLKAAIVAKVPKRATTALEYKPSQILVSVGGNRASSICARHSSIRATK